MLAADYPFLDVLWTMIVFFLWIAWFWLLIKIFADIFRRDDISGWGKAGWLIFVIALPFLGVFVYLIAHSRDMTQRDIDQARAAQSQFDQYVQTVAAGGSGTVGEIERAKGLLDSGAITQAEFDAIKQKALAAS